MEHEVGLRTVQPADGVCEGMVCVGSLPAVRRGPLLLERGAQPVAGGWTWEAGLDEAGAFIDSFPTVIGCHRLSPLRRGTHDVCKDCGAG